MMRQNNGFLIWITGLPGAGKTTLAKKVYTLLSKKVPTIFMDGDAFREIMGNDLGYSKKDRLKNAFRLARMNKYLVDHGMLVVCATVSLYRPIHLWNRKHVKKMLEVYIDVPPHTLKKRNQKGLYGAAAQGQAKNLIGVHQSFDIPKNPDMVITNTKSLKSFLSSARRIAQSILRK